MPNLQNIAKGIIDLSYDKECNLAYLKEILQKEVDRREEFAVLRREKAGRLPKKEFAKTSINSEIVWQTERLEELEWIEKDQNLILIGKCGNGKTSLAAHIGRKAQEAGIKVSHNTFDDFLCCARKYQEWCKSLKCNKNCPVPKLICIIMGSAICYREF